MNQNILDSKRLSVAAWFCVVSAAIAVPLAILALAARRHPGLAYWNAILDVGNVIAYVYIWLTFKRLLNLNAKFSPGNVFIDIMIWMNIIFRVPYLFTFPFAHVHKVLGFALLLCLIPYGVICIVFGIRLLNCENKLFGYLKALSILCIVVGASSATVILVPIALLAYIPFNILLALVFFRSATPIQESGQP